MATKRDWALAGCGLLSERSDVIAHGLPGVASVMTEQGEVEPLSGIAWFDLPGGGCGDFRNFLKKRYQPYGSLVFGCGFGNPRVTFS